MKRTQGFFIFEILIAIVVLTMVTLSIATSINFLQLRSIRSKHGSQASILIQEATEIAYNALLLDWVKYPDGVYHPAYDATQDVWILLKGKEDNLQTRYQRKIELSQVCRDTNTGENIGLNSETGSCSGKVDVNSRQIKTTILWQESGQVKTQDVSLLVFKMPER